MLFSYRVEDQHSGVLRHQPKTAELVGIKNSSIRSKRVGVSRKSVVDNPSCKESWNSYLA